MSVFDALPSHQSLNYMKRLALAVALELPFTPSAQDYWVFYGSVVINSLRPESDIDVLYVSAKPLDRPFRHQAYFEGRPVTVYVLTESQLLSDGSDYTFGGYFSGKLLSAHVVLDSTGKPTQGHDETVARTIGGFMSSFVELDATISYSYAELASKVIQAYVALCPWYEAYLVKFFHGKTEEDMQGIAQSLKDNYVQALEVAGAVSREGALYKVHKVGDFSESLYRRRIRAITRFWSYGAIEHGNNHQFADYYFDKANDALKDRDPDGALLAWVRQEFSLESLESEGK